MRITPTRRRLIATAAAMAVAPARAWAGAPAPSVLMPGWREAILIVPDLAPWIETLTTVGRWEVAYRSARDASLNTLWSLPATVRTEQALMRNIGTNRGYIRLVRVLGASQVQIRPDDQAWETGGVQALDLRVVDLEATRAALHARGWRAPSDPVRYKTYGVEVIQWAPTSPDGVRLSFIQRIAPPLVGWAELKQWSHAANAAVTTRDMAAAAAFFGGLAGMKEASHSNTVGGDGPNVMGLPWALARRTPTTIVGYADPSGLDGAVELIALPEAQGRDYAPAAHPPNLGIAGLRVMTADAALAAARFQAQGHGLAAPVQTLTLASYGPCRAFAVTAPDGVWLEFLQPLQHG